MAQTTNVTLGSTWTQVASTGDEYVIQNPQRKTIEVMLKDTAPSESEKGHLIGYMEGIDHNTFGQGDVYARAKVDGLAIVTK